MSVCRRLESCVAVISPDLVRYLPYLALSYLNDLMKDNKYFTILLYDFSNLLTPVHSVSYLVLL